MPKRKSKLSDLEATMIAEGAQEGNVMPAFGENTNVEPHINDIYRYVKARADGKIRRGVRLPKLPKFKEE